MKGLLLTSTLICSLPLAFEALSLTSEQKGLDKRSPDSAAMLDYWNMTDAIVDGHEAVRNQKEKYLPKFVDEDDDDYKFRLRLTKFTNIYRDIIESLSAKPFEKEVEITNRDEQRETPAHLIEFIKDVDGAGNNLTTFSSQTFFNGINSAIDWIMIDYPSVEQTDRVRSIAEAKKEGRRPTWSHVLGRNVLDAQVENINGEETLTYVKILEPGETPSKNEIRIFSRMPNGNIVWSLWKIKEYSATVNSETIWKQIAGGMLTIDVIPLVPFITGRRDGKAFRIHPVMKDSADLQIELYQSESNLKFTRHMVAFPMLAGNGVSPPKAADGKQPEKIRVGPNRVLYAPVNTSGGQPGRWEFIEPSAESLKFLQEDIEGTKRELREIGRQPLTVQSGNLTVVTTQVAAGKARSAVAAWAIKLRDALKQALIITEKWMNAKNVPDYGVHVYKEFDQFIEGKDLDTLVELYKERAISLQTLWSEMKRRGVFSDDFVADAETKRMLDEVPWDDLTDEINDGDSENEIS